MAVIAFIDRSPVSKSVIEHAVWASKGLDQPVTLVTVDERLHTDPGVGLDAYQGMDAHEDIVRELASTGLREQELRADDNAAYLQSAARLAREHGAAQVRTRQANSSLTEYIAESTDSDDLLVIGRRGDSDAELGSHLDDVLHVRHRTLLVVPDVFGTPANWLLAYDGRAASGECVRYLSRFPLLNGIPGKAVVAGNDPHARVHFRDAIGHLRGAGYRLDAHELSGSPDDVLPAVLEVACIDMLVMGAYGGGRLRSLLERSTTVRLLKSFAGPVLISRS